MKAAFERLIHALESHGSKVNDTGHRASAQCPAHDDTAPSLALTRIEGSVLLHCHAGCATVDVLAALDLTKSDLYDEPKPRKVAGIPAHATYTYDNGRRVVRSADKEFRQTGTDKPTELYRLAEVRAAVAEGRPVFVVEGEKDVHALKSLGVTATCSPMGAGKWSKVDPTPLYGGNVLVIADQDEPGRAHAQQIRASLAGRAEVAVFAPKSGKDAADHIAAGHGIADFVRVADGAHADAVALLDDVQRFLGRFVAFPTLHALTAVTLWAAHAHLVEAVDSTPRLALLSPEPGSGKTRTLEVLELLTPNPMHALNGSSAPIFRSIEADRPTLLMDECDAIFGRSAKSDDPAADLRALLNAGHRKGATIPRCVGPTHEVVRFPVFAAVALAGLGDLPDTLMSRSLIVRMRRRAPGERVEPFRHRMHAADGHELRDRLAAWCAAVAEQVGAAWPALPEGITDRPADCWEPLLAVADAAGGTWPATARAACVELCRVAAGREASLGVRLLGDLRTVWQRLGDPLAASTGSLLTDLIELDESPWADLHGRALDSRGLARRLRQYEITSTTVKVEGVASKGYRREHLWDAWQRYCPTPSVEPLPALPALQPSKYGAREVTDEVTDELPRVTPSVTLQASEHGPRNPGNAGNATSARDGRAEPEHPFLADLAEDDTAPAGTGDDEQETGASVAGVEYRPSQDDEPSGPASPAPSGNPSCSVCGKPNLFHRVSIERGICASCVKALGARGNHHEESA